MVVSYSCTLYTLLPSNKLRSDGVIKSERENRVGQTCVARTAIKRIDWLIPVIN